MIIPKWITSYTVVRTKPGIYTPMITFPDCEKIRARKWLDKHGKQLMEFMLGFKVRDYAKL